MVAPSVQIPLKIKTDSKFYQFAEWYESSRTSINPENGRKRKGNFKKFLIEEIENLLISGNCGLVKVAAEFKKAEVLPPQLKEAQQNLNETDFAKLVELMEKAKTK
jgi:hypothetical protein